MKLSQRYAFATSAVILLIAALAVSCRKHKMDNMGMAERNITYPPAYVVNGECNTISVININTVTDSIELMSSGNAMPMCPHHIYHYSGTHLLSIGLPGVDLSARHSGNLGAMNGKVLVVDGRKGNIIKGMEVPAINHNADFSPNGKGICTSQQWMHGSVFNTGAGAHAVAFSSDGSVAYVTNQLAAGVSIINTTDHTKSKI
ncbi:YncE family protein [Chitinophaga sancti]|uniref:YncE family protein n=1 Tax=Chitinophaga sancti TaxID=1004 RepID=UPI003F7A0326